MIITIQLIFFLSGIYNQPPPPGGSEITRKDAPRSVGLLWTSDQPVAETWQHTQHSQQTNIHAPVSTQPALSRFVPTCSQTNIKFRFFYTAYESQSHENEYKSDPFPCKMLTEWSVQCRRIAFTERYDIKLLYIRINFTLQMINAFLNV
jgi:hypothetical protein